MIPVWLVATLLAGWFITAQSSIANSCASILLNLRTTVGDISALEE
jgi:hypothetical protein